MTRTTLFGVIALLLVANTASAQSRFGTGKRGSFPGCPTCGVVSAIDTPTVSSPSKTIPAWALYFAGWGFECYRGDAVERVDVFYRNDDGEIVPAKTAFVPGLPRPDVQNAMSGQCAAPWNSGFHVYLLDPLPRGQREIYLTVWHGPYYETHRRDVFLR